MKGSRKPVLRCAIYTRKSSEEGLEQAFNSLEAQREACEAYIRSQAHEGWRPTTERFDDGGHSGGTLERPAMQCLLEKVRARKIDVIVIYKIDRLTRSLSDFAKLAELFDAQKVSFVSVTQQFNTTTSMGRLMLNVLLSFAQFEREVTGERIRDKVAASKKKGMWMGGNVPLGYDAVNKALAINPAEAETVRTLYRLYLKHGRVRTVVAEAGELRLRTKVRISPEGKKSGGGQFYPGHVYGILKNPIYVGRVPHKTESYPASHAAIIDEPTWNAVQEKIAANRITNRTRLNARTRSLLAGLLIDAQGNRFTPSHAVKSGRRYRYYIERALRTGVGQAKSKTRRIPAEEIESAVRSGILDLFGSTRQLLDALGPDVGVSATKRAIQKARELRQDLLHASSETWRDRLKSLLAQAVIEDAALRLRIARNGLWNCLSPSDASGRSSENETDLFDHVIPIRMTMSGIRMKLVVGGEGNQVRRQHDKSLIKAVARGHEWFERLKNGETKTVREIAKAEGVTESYVTRVMRTAFLAPDLVELILDGRQTTDFATGEILRSEGFCEEWAAQRARFSGLVAWSYPQLAVAKS